MTQALKVDLRYLEYRGRGLRIAAELVDHAGERVYVFDKNLVFTQHAVEAIEDGKAVIGTAIPFTESGVSDLRSWCA